MNAINSSIALVLGDDDFSELMLTSKGFALTGIFSPIIPIYTH